MKTMSAYLAFRKVKEIIVDEKGNPKEILTTIPVRIHYNSGIPKNHRMLR